MMYDALAPSVLNPPDIAVTLLFSDIQDATALTRRLGSAYDDLIADHHRIMRAAIAANDGYELNLSDDSCSAAFASSSAAIGCAVEAQRTVSGHSWPTGSAQLVRMGVHTGYPVLHRGTYRGIDVRRAAGVMSVAFGGQVLLTDDARRALDAPVSLRDLGYHRLKDLPAHERLFQLVAPGLPDAFPPLRSLNNSNLPGFPNPLVGRETERRQVLTLLDREDIRLLTLIGPGGAGKTRLALETAAEAAVRYQHGVWIISLGAIRDSDLVIPELCRVLGVEAPPGPLENALHESLRDRRMLLVLDNLEHLDGAAAIVSGLLAAATELDVLVTSRSALRIRGEHRFEVPPLPLEAATELFRQRVADVRPDAGLTDNEVPTVRRICQRLDGLPLAVELVAGAVAILPPSALEPRLARLRHTIEGPRDLPERQRTLRATMEWSYQLLEPAERRLLQVLSPFVGGARIGSVEAVAPDDLGETVSRLASLRDKSMLQLRHDADGEPRFWLLETIRTFAVERAIADGAWSTAADHHAQHFISLSEQAEGSLRTVSGESWLTRLDAEQANLRAALDHLHEHDPRTALRMAGALAGYWCVRGLAGDGYRRFIENLEMISSDSPVPGPVLTAGAGLALAAGDPSVSERLARGGLTWARQAGDTVVQAECLSRLAVSEQLLGDPEERFERRHRDAIARARQSGDDAVLVHALSNCATQFHVRGDVQRARPLYEEAITVQRRLGGARGRALLACNLAEIALDFGEFDTAKALLDEALENARVLDYRAIIASSLVTGALLLLDSSQFEAAARQLADAIEPTTSASDLETVPVLLSAAADVAAAGADPVRAATLWAAADRTLVQQRRRETPTAAMLRERWLPRAQAQARDVHCWEKAWAAGTELTDEEALTLAAAVVAPYNVDDAHPADRGTDAAAVPLPPPRTAGAPPPSPAPGGSSDELTVREAQVLRLVAKGLSDAEIADELVVSRRTVHAHLRAVYRKLRVSSRSAATRWALENGFG